MGIIIVAVSGLRVVICHRKQVGASRVKRRETNSAVSQLIALD